MIALSACGMASQVQTVANVVNASTSTQPIWSDVPAFEGATQDPKEGLGTSLFNQAQADQKSKMETMIFHTTKSPADIAGFYTQARMSEKGWTPQGLGTSQGGCLQDHYDGQPRAMCSFMRKNEEGREIDLTIDARPDPNGHNDTRRVFVRETGSLVTP